jgi:flavin-dependent dehydrogenase
MTKSNGKQSNHYDAIIIGGGPAGSTAGCLLAKHGCKALVLEKEEFPRFAVGESLMPDTYHPLKRLGMIEKLRNSHFVKKYSVQFVSEEGKESRPFYFNETHEGESSQTWQVLRSEFDEMLLDNASDNGAEVREGVMVRDVLFDGQRATGVKVKTKGGKTEQINATVIVDASGQSSLLAKKLKLRKNLARLKKMSFYAYFKGGIRDSGKDAGVTRLCKIRGGGGWFWYIPLPNDEVSVGVVADPATLFEGRERNPDKILEEEIALQPWIKKRLEPARKDSKTYVVNDFSFRSSRCAGDHWVMAGDAFGFIDPLYASGVYLALKTGEFAADAICNGLKTGDLSGGKLGHWGPKVCGGFEAMRSMVYSFYTPGFFMRDFVKAHPEHTKHLINLLIGEIFEEENYAIFDNLKNYCELEEAIPLDDPDSPVAALSS